MQFWERNIITPDGNAQTFERRALRRLAMILDISICRITQGKFCRLTAQDISTGGLRFKANVAFNVGELIDLSIPLEPTLGPINVVGKIAWCRALPESRSGVYEGGISFTRISVKSHERLQRFIDSSDPALKESKAGR